MVIVQIGAKKVQQQEADGKNGHITYDVGLHGLDILKVAEYLGRVCYEKKYVTYDAKLGIQSINLKKFRSIYCHSQSFTAWDYPFLALHD